MTGRRRVERPAGETHFGEAGRAEQPEVNAFEVAPSHGVNLAESRGSRRPGELDATSPRDVGDSVNAWHSERGAQTGASASGKKSTGFSERDAAVLPVGPVVSARRAAAKRRRRAERISRADQTIIAEGGIPSWEQIRELEPQKWVGKREEPTNESARDREFRENKPPHW